MSNKLYNIRAGSNKELQLKVKIFSKLLDIKESNIDIRLTGKVKVGNTEEDLYESRIEFDPRGLICYTNGFPEYCKIIKPVNLIFTDKS